MMSYTVFDIDENSYKVKIVRNNKCKQVYALRHKIFAEELKWIERKDDGMDIDEYDQGAISFGVFNLKDRLLGSFRIIPHDQPFMLENDFLFLINQNHELRKQADTIEISRFCIDNHSRFDQVISPFGASKTSLLLYKLLYQWCCLQSVRYSYAVVEKKFLRRLNLSFLPFKAIDEPKVMKDKIEAVAVIIDWKEFQYYIKRNSIELLQWFNNFNISDLIDPLIAYESNIECVPFSHQTHTSISF